MSYSLDFRECVIKNIKAGMSWKEASKTFNISTGTISKWLGNLSQTGKVSDAPRKEYKPRKICSQALMDKISECPDATLEELADHFNCWPHAIFRRLKKLGITRKKKQHYILKETKKKGSSLQPLFHKKSQKT